MSRVRLSIPACALLLSCLLGCAAGVHWISDPERNRVIRVESGDRWFLTLDESDADERSACRWTARSDDKDAEVVIDHEDGEAKVTIRIHRGFDGPATIVFSLRRPGVKEPMKSFAIACYRRTGDSAFWTK